MVGSGGPAYALSSDGSLTPKPKKWNGIVMQLGASS